MRLQDKHQQVIGHKGQAIVGRVSNVRIKDGGYHGSTVIGNVRHDCRQISIGVWQTA